MKKGEAALEAKGSSGVPAESSALAFFDQAAEAAPDDDKKYRALTRAAEVATQIKNFQGAVELYDKARKLLKISTEQKAIAQFGYAASRHQDAKIGNKPLDLIVPIRAEYEAAVKLLQLPRKYRIQAHEAIGDLFILQGQRLTAVREYQKILALPSAKIDSIQSFYLNRIFTELQKTEASTEAVELAESAFKQWLPLQKTQRDVAAVKDRFAQILIAQKQEIRAIPLWNEIANEATLPATERAQVLRKVGALQRSLKNWPDALATADRLGNLPEVSDQFKPSLTAWRGWDRADVFLGQGDEPKARAEWESVIAVPQVAAEEKSRLWMEIGYSYGRELQASPQNTAPADLQKQAFENAWKLDGAEAKTRTQALLNRGQIELNAKNPAAAITLLTDGLKVIETWKPVPETAQSKRDIHFALAAIYRNQKNYDLASAELVQAQQFSKKDDKQVMQTAVAVSQDAFAAGQWAAARANLIALQSVWGMSRKTYLLNLVQIEVAEKKWEDAKKALDEIATLNPTLEEKKLADELRAKIPAA